MATECTVWRLYQARCLLCVWSAEVTSDAGSAAYDARDHRASDEHKQKLTARRRSR